MHGSNAPEGARYHRQCPECGDDFMAKRAHARFCSDRCRKAWNNRAAVRGVELYHALMNARYDRNTPGALTLLSRIAARYRAEDHRDRDGRVSWDSLVDVKARNVDAAATVYRVR